ncbi:MAG: flavodoxin-dependent (E)-4-hydroxy-3-methylbut-2-enyl-diphosphate synthase [Armatimonadetes bacterium]|nr:flavodoxin-dependent (E)-4-hydroxy-3-methylbut-2-enyl-diphosphate synthase [Armatimonadota bacterium]
MGNRRTDSVGFPARRRRTRPVRVGALTIGGDAPVSVQSMAKCPTTDLDSVAQQIKRVAAAGCDAFRVAVPDMAAVEALPAILEASPMPIIADVHFDWRLAVEAVRRGAHKVRLNPGNIGGRENVARVAEACLEHGAAMRLGVNAGSLERDLLDKYGGATAEALAESALRCASLGQDVGLDAVVISIKAHDVVRTVTANRIFAAESDMPLHLGVTEAGSGAEGLVRSAVGIGVLLAEGIGDTIRVSLTAPPEEEVRAGRLILQSLGLQRGPVVVSCPTCGRTQIPVRELAEEVRTALKDVQAPVVVAVMGCEVNGPGEAREADLGIAGGRERAVIFRSGKVVRTVQKSEAVRALLEELDRLLCRGNG